MNERVKIHTDGACLINPGGPGGFAVVISPEADLCVSDKTVFWSSGHPQTTNNVMELSGVLEALRWIKEQGRTNVMIYSDSQYVVKGANDWMFKWQKKNWKNGQVKNLAIWKEIYGLYQETKSRLSWVRGHDGNVFNEFADQLAGKSAAQFAAQRTAKYPTIEVGNTVALTQSDSYFVRRFVIMQKYDINSTIILKPLNFKSKPWVMSDKEFNEKRLILL